MKRFPCAKCKKARWQKTLNTVAKQVFCLPCRRKMGERLAEKNTKYMKAYGA